MSQPQGGLPTLDQVMQSVAAEQKSAVTAVAAEGLPPPESKAEAVEVAKEVVAEAETTQTEEAPKAEESAPEPAKEESKKEDKMASRFAALSRKEKEIRQREAEMERRMSDFEAKFKAMEERENKWASVKKAPLKSLQELGISFQDLTQDAIGAYKEPEVDPTTKRFSELEQRLQKIDEIEKQLHSKFSELDEKEARIATREVMDSIKEAASDEKYELIQNVGDEALSLVKDVMSEYWTQYQKILDYSEACDIVEKYYEDYFDKVAKTRKMKSRFTDRPSERPAESAQPRPKQVTKEVKEPISTLTHSQSSAASNIDVDKLSGPEAIQHLARQLKYLD